MSHIITAGEAICASYATTIRNHPDITHIFVFADTELYTNTTGTTLQPGHRRRVHGMR